MDPSFFRVRADIDLGAISKNIRTIQKGLRRGTKTCAVVKADAYGHGAVRVARHINDIVDFFAVATIEEAMELRGSGIKKPILILGFTHPERFAEAIKNDIRITVFDADTGRKIAEKAREIGKTARVHIKLDTGMNRIGFKADKESIKAVKKLSRTEGIEVEGLFTHLHSADGRSKASAMKQILEYGEFINDLEKEGIIIPVKHCANSAAAINLKLAGFDMVRLGIVMYGLYPSKYVKNIKLKPALSLVSHIIMIKSIEAGETVGYGANWSAKTKSVIATVPVGYADGYLRILSNKGQVLVRGSKAPVCGNICMDQLMIDITRISKARLNDEVVIYGKQKDAEISLEDAAAAAQTINYELACAVSPRVKRRYLVKGKEV